MKYIRTKDEIFDVEKYGGIRTIIKVYDVDETLRIKYENTNEPQQVGDRFVIIENKDYKITDNNTADTIEELCDEFVINVGEKGYLIVDNFKTFVEYSKQGIKEQVDIKCFGAIWTDKGLIYVAKMNDKGELELL